MHPTAFNNASLPAACLLTRPTHPESQRARCLRPGDEYGQTHQPRTRSAGPFLVKQRPCCAHLANPEPHRGPLMRALQHLRSRLNTQPKQGRHGFLRQVDEEIEALAGPIESRWSGCHRGHGLDQHTPCGQTQFPGLKRQALCRHQRPMRPAAGRHHPGRTDWHLPGAAAGQAKQPPCAATALDQQSDGHAGPAALPGRVTPLAIVDEPLCVNIQSNST